MDKGIAFFKLVHDWIETNLGVGAAYSILVISVFMFVFAFRKVFPNAWIWLVKRIPYIDFELTPIQAFLDKALQALPGTLFAAFLGWAGTGGSLKQALLASLAGPVAAIAHHILQAVPWIPYLGKLGKKAKRRFTPPEGTPTPQPKDEP